MFKLNTKFDADPLLYSVILNVMATQYTCSLSGVYCPQPTSTVKLSLFLHVRSSPVLWLPAYIDVMHAVLIILTMAGLSLDRPHIYGGIVTFLVW